MPETLRGKSDKETLDLVAKHLASAPKAPAKADEYAFTPGKEISHLVGDLSNDKVLPLFRDVAHGLGLSQPQFDGVINGLYGKMMEAGLMRPPVDVTAEFRALGGSTGDAATQIANGQRRVADLAGQIEGLATRKELSAEQAKKLIDGLSDAGEMIAMERLLSLIPSARGPQNGGQPGGTAVSKADVLQRMDDPRYNFRSGKFDQRFYEETNRLYQQAAGTG